MKSINKVILLGNLGKDPEVKYTQNGKAVAKLSLATSTRVKDSGEWRDKTEWHTLILWEKLAEVAGERLLKGARLYVEGRIETQSWEDKKSNERKYRTQIVVSELVMLGAEGKEEQAAIPARTAAHASAITPQNPITDDDIPF